MRAEAVIVIMTLLVLGCTQGKPIEPMSGLDGEQMKRCVANLGESSWIVRRRALQWLASRGPAAGDATRTVLRILAGDRDRPNAFQILLTLEAIGGRSLPWVLMARIREHADTDSERLAFLLIALARQGPTGRPILAELKQFLENGDLDDGDKAVGRVALWCIAGTTESDLVEAIHTALGGGSTKAEATVWALGLSGRLPEDAPVLVPRLLEVASGGTDDSAWALVALAAGIREQAGTHLPTLRTLRDRLAGDENAGSLPIIAAYAVARISRASEDLDAAVELSSREEGRIFVAAHLMVAGTLINGELLAGLIQRLSHRKEMRRAGAMAILRFVGLRARDGVVPLLNVLREDKNPEIRKIAAETMQYVGDDSAVPALENAMDKEVDEFVRDSIRDAIAVLRKG